MASFFSENISTAIGSAPARFYPTVHPLAMYIDDDDEPFRSNLSPSYVFYLSAFPRNLTVLRKNCITYQSNIRSLVAGGQPSAGNQAVDREYIMQIYSERREMEPTRRDTIDIYTHIV